VYRETTALFVLLHHNEPILIIRTEICPSHQRIRSLLHLGRIVLSSMPKGLDWPSRSRTSLPMVGARQPTRHPMNPRMQQAHIPVAELELMDPTPPALFYHLLHLVPVPSLARVLVARQIHSLGLILLIKLRSQVTIVLKRRSPHYQAVS
jgi:hypothetical protein